MAFVILSAATDATVLTWGLQSQRPSCTRVRRHQYGLVNAARPHTNPLSSAVASSSVAGGWRRNRQQNLRVAVGASAMSMLTTDHDDTVVASEGANAALPERRPTHDDTATTGGHPVGPGKSYQN